MENEISNTSFVLLNKLQLKGEKQYTYAFMGGRDKAISACRSPESIVLRTYVHPN
jgi:hypothetical protein